jgi:alpha-beta hydrolase superfamily lysophospholipase
MAALLLVHGAWHGAWCWTDFARRLTAAGHEAHALDLRGHGTPPTGRIHHRIRDYVDDVRAEAERIGDDVVVVGHSMGALVVQKYLEDHQARGAVLLAPGPPRGVTGATLRFGARHPLVLGGANLGWRLGPVVGTPALAREMLFTPETPADIVEAAFPRLQDESFRAYLDQMFFALPRPTRIRTPMLVLGGELDRTFTVGEVRATARAYGAEAEIFDGMGHDLMLDVGWEQVADRVDEWVRALS